MKKIKKIVMRSFFAFEIILFIFFYFFGAYGLQAMVQLKRENSYLLQEIVSLGQEITHLEQEINAWITDPFYKEKVAREQLQMARSGDQIYYLS